MLLETREALERRATKGWREFRETAVLKVCGDSRVLKVYGDSREFKVMLVFKDPKESEDFREILGSKVFKVSKVL